MFYTTSEGENAREIEIRRSVFICSVKGVANFDEGMEFVGKIKKKYSDATHNCYAVLCLDGQKFSDDGEPQGTAGQPILQTLKKQNLTNVAAVVTRYFGGIKLGAGGLVSAYTQAVTEALKDVERVTVYESALGEISADYGEYRAINSCVERFGKVNKVEFSDGAKILFAVPVEEKEKLSEEILRISAGKTAVRYLGTGFEKYNGRK